MIESPKGIFTAPGISVGLGSIKSTALLSTKNGSDFSFMHVLLIICVSRDNTCNQWQPFAICQQIYERISLAGCNWLAINSILWSCFQSVVIHSVQFSLNYTKLATSSKRLTGAQGPLDIYSDAFLTVLIWHLLLAQVDQYQSWSEEVPRFYPHWRQFVFLLNLFFSCVCLCCNVAP